MRSFKPGRLKTGPLPLRRGIRVRHFNPLPIASANVRETLDITLSLHSLLTLLPRAKSLL
jgi:hypothetical protein